MRLVNHSLLYVENARLMREGLHAAGFTLYGGVNAPYIWVKAPEGLDLWSFFEMLLHEVNVVGTPGVGSDQAEKDSATDGLW